MGGSSSGFPGAAKSCSRDPPPQAGATLGSATHLSPAERGDQESLPSLTQARNRNTGWQGSVGPICAVGITQHFGGLGGTRMGVYDLGAVAGTEGLLCHSGKHRKERSDDKKRYLPGELPIPSPRGPW